VNPLDLRDGAWPTLEGGYRVPVDIRPLLLELERAADPATAWSNLWQELFHQGAIGRASFAAVPHLVRIHEQRRAADWNTYVLAATVELARATDGNPDLPATFRSAYDDAWSRLERVALAEYPGAKTPELVRGILSVLAIRRGARQFGRLVLEFSEDEIRATIDRLFDEA
jgi:hypothetical protein